MKDNLNKNLENYKKNKKYFLKIFSSSSRKILARPVMRPSSYAVFPVKFLLYVDSG